MPQAAFLSSFGFVALAFITIPTGGFSSLGHLAQFAASSTKFQGYVAAALLNLSIAPWTARVMIPTNFELIRMNEAMGGARSAASASQQTSDQKSSKRSALDSVNGEGQANQFTDLSGPQEKTTRDSTPEEDAKVRTLLDRFARLNNVRAFLCAAGGTVGLITALM